jgi:SPP1 family predicted phage head-tail adaptor
MGGFTTVYVTKATVYPTRMNTLRTDEAILAMQSTGTAIHNIEIRWRSDVKTSWRIKFGDRYFNIIGPPIDVNFQRKFLNLKVKEAA